MRHRDYVKNICSAHVLEKSKDTRKGGKCTNIWDFLRLKT